MERENTYRPVAPDYFGRIGGMLTGIVNQLKDRFTMRISLFIR